MRGNRKPNFRPTKAQQKDVELFVAVGMSEEEIAAALSICRNTLRKHFPNELLTGHARFKAENLRLLKKAAKAGNVTAMKHLDSKSELQPYRAPPSKHPELGKKEELNQQAQTAHKQTGWGELLN